MHGDGRHSVGEKCPSPLQERERFSCRTLCTICFQRCLLCTQLPLQTLWPPVLTARLKQRGALLQDFRVSRDAWKKLHPGGSTVSSARSRSVRSRCHVRSAGSACRCPAWVGPSVSAFRYTMRSYPHIRVNGGGKEPSGTGTQPPLLWPQCLRVSLSHLRFLGLSVIFTRLGSKHRLPWSSCGMEGTPSPR